MTIINLDNITSTLSEEQMKVRCGKLCASSNHKLMGAKGLGKTGLTYLWERIAEKETGKNISVPTTLAMKWGIAHEQEAIKAFASITGLSTLPGSTIVEQELVATPDFICIDKGGEYFGGEVKCPHNSAKHSQRLRYKGWEDVKKNLPEYYWQMVSGMLASGFEKWVFVSYDPRFKDVDKQLVVINIPYVENDVELMKERIAQAMKFYKENDVEFYKENNVKL
jgi:hypothetical protein